MNFPQITTANKILITIIAIISIIAVSIIAYQSYIFNKQTIQIQNSMLEMQKLKDEVVRSQSQYVNKEGFDKFVEQNKINLEEISKDLKALGGQISAINVVVANSSGQVVNGAPSTNVIPVPNPTPTTPCSNSPDCVLDKYHYFTTIQSLNIFEDFAGLKVPTGKVEFNAGTPDNKPWNFQIFPREYKIDNTIAHLEDGRTAVYNALTIKSNDGEYSIPISSSKTVQQFPANSFSFWNPILALGISAGVGVSSENIRQEVTPAFGAHIMSYGKTKINPDLKVLGLSVGYNIVQKSPALELSPIQLNIGNTLSTKLLSNTYIGPTIGADTSKSVQFGVGIGVSL